MNTIVFELTDEAMAAYRDKKAGDSFSCKNITGTVTANDGTTLQGTIESIEPSEYAEAEPEAEAPVEEMAEPPAAVAALGGKKAA